MRTAEQPVDDRHSHQHSRVSTQNKQHRTFSVTYMVHTFVQPRNFFQQYATGTELISERPFHCDQVDSTNTRAFLSTHLLDFSGRDWIQFSNGLDGDR
jgi:hypothetical protein